MQKEAWIFLSSVDWRGHSAVLVRDTPRGAWGFHGPTPHVTFGESHTKTGNKGVNDNNIENEVGLR